jgi:hypothetical protein
MIGQPKSAHARRFLQALRQLVSLADQAQLVAQIGYDVRSII